MITPKRVKLTPADERDNYESATLRDSETCVMRDLIFGCLGGVHRDHRQNRDPYNTVPSNIQCLCLLHHKWKTEHPEAAIREGWGMPRHTLLTPAQWPARRQFRGDYGIQTLGWVLYDDAGHVLEITESEALRRMRGDVA